jgi:hypothetical protein
MSHIVRSIIARAARITAATLVALLPATVLAQAPIGAIPFDAGWTLRGDSARIESFDGRRTFSVQSGFAFRPDVRLMDGSIDFDVWTTERRSFVYLMFRMQSDSAYEDLYLRPHKSDAPDALQYAPVYQAASAWQLYHGATGTAPVAIPDGRWNHVRVVLRGRQAAFFVNDTVRPALIVHRLGHEPREGSIALRGFLPAGVPAAGPIARFANVVVRPDYVPFDFPAPTIPSDEGVVRSWLVGAPFAATDRVAPEREETARMRRVEALPGGLVELHRLVPLPTGMRNPAVNARLVVQADTAGVYAMDLGFSDIVTASVNGVPLFRGDDSYDYANRRDGLIAFSQARLYLPLRAGRNTLDLTVSDVFGGWGIMARFPSMAGLRLLER